MKYLIQDFIVDTFHQFPSRTAVKQGDRLYSYGEIDELSSKFENYFNTHTPARKIIGILSRVRAEAIVAMIGALRAGVVYVPLNILAPSSWLGNVINNARIEVLLVDSAFMDVAESLREFGVKQIICLDDNDDVGSKDGVNFSTIRQITLDNVGKATAMEAASAAVAAANDTKAKAPGIETVTEAEAAAESSSKPTASFSSAGKVGMLADDIAYVLYTSGSTGSPKGIMITHRNAFTFIDWMQKEFALTADDRVFNRAPLQFDLSVFDIFSTFAAGAQLVIAAMGASTQANDVLDLMRREKISIVYTVPSTFINWLSKGDLSAGLPTLRLVLYAGEPFPLPYLRKFKDCLPETQISNIYGPTETNIVTYYHIKDLPEEWESVPIGIPVHDTEIFIVDDDMKAVSGDEIGEILVRGGTVFAGYFNDSKRTAEKLIQSPFHNYPTLCCRTGDLGRFLPDGNIVYHGRADNMVKTRGYRVELGEVETALSSISGIDELAVIAKPHEKYGNSLHAFVSCKSGSPSESEISSQLALKVPSYMMPYEIISLDALPKTSTGKIDRVSLRESLDKERSKK